MASTIAKAAAKADALAGLERWKARHPAVVPHLEAADVLVDSMRGRSSTWTPLRPGKRTEGGDAETAMQSGYRNRRPGEDDGSPT